MAHRIRGEHLENFKQERDGPIDGYKIQDALNRYRKIEFKERPMPVRRGMTNLGRFEFVPQVN